MQRALAGQRHRRPQQALVHPEPHQGGPHRRPGAAIAVAVATAGAVATAAAVAAEPGVQPARRGEQRGGAGHRGGEALVGPPHGGFLVAVRCGEPLVQLQRVAGRREDGAAVDHPQGVIHAQAQAFEHGGEVPGIDRQAIGRGLAAHRGEPGAVQQRRQQRMPGERLVEPGERGGGLRQGGGERRIKRSRTRRSQQRVEQWRPPADRPARRGAGRDRRGAAALRRKSMAYASAYANPDDSVQCACYIGRPPCPGLVCPIRPLVGHSNCAQSDPPNTAASRQERAT